MLRVLIGVAAAVSCASALAVMGVADADPAIPGPAAPAVSAPAPGTLDLNVNGSNGDAEHEAALGVARGMQSQAEAIAKADSRLSTLLAGAGVSIATQDTVVDGERVVGTALEVSFAATRTVTASLSTEEVGPLFSGAKSVRTEGVTKLLVLVDVERGKVIGINALDGTRYTFLDALGNVLGAVNG